MVKLNFFLTLYFLYPRDFNKKKLDFSPLKVIDDVKYSCWKTQFIGKIERNKILVFTKVYLAEFFISGNLQKFIHAKLKNCANLWPHKSFCNITVEI